MLNAVEKTKNNSKLILNFAINYGSRDEIVRAVNEIIKSEVTEVSEDTISDFLDTKGLPEVDLLIRTGGEQRLSNYLLWQLAYAEMAFVDVAWPEFSREMYEGLMHDFINKNRRFGGL